VDVEGTDPYDYCIFFGYYLIVSFVVSSLLMNVEEIMDCYVDN
jgi:hypothetical protein